MPNAPRADGLAPLYDAALSEDAPGAWIRAAIEALRESADDAEQS